jgi:hypothetical protein
VLIAPAGFRCVFFDLAMLEVVISGQSPPFYADLPQSSPILCLGHHRLGIRLCLSAPVATVITR